MTNQQGAPEALRLADEYAAAHAKWALEDLYGTSKAYTSEKLAERHAARERLAALVEAQQPAPSAAQPATEPVTSGVADGAVWVRYDLTDGLKEQAIKDQLIALGWTPPPAGAKPSPTPQADSQPEPVRNLQWTQDTPPTHGICSYDHCTAQSPLGPFRIEWKSWKEHDARCLYLNGEYIGCAATTDDAKQLAQGHIESIAKELAPYRAARAPADSQPAPVLDSLTLMKVVMQADEALAGHCIRGTTNWAAAIGMTVQSAVLAARAPADSVAAPAGGNVAQYVQVLPKRARIPKDFLLPNCVDKQYHAGRLFGSGKAVWHTDGEGKFWCGQWHHRTPRELESECLSILRDLWAIAGISQHTPPAQAADSVLEDAARLDFLCSTDKVRMIECEQNGLWRVYQDEAPPEAAQHHWQAIASEWHTTPRAAIDAAIAARKQGANHD